jgi:hypothetical protein
MKGYLSNIPLKIIESRLSVGALDFGDFCKEITKNLDTDSLLLSRELNKKSQHLNFSVGFPKFTLNIKVIADNEDTEIHINGINEIGETYTYMFDDFDGVLQFSSKKQHGRTKCKDIRELLCFRVN